MSADQRNVDAAGDQRFERRIGRWLGKAVEPAVLQVRDAQRELKTEQGKEREDVVGIAAAVRDGFRILAAALAMPGLLRLERIRLDRQAVMFATRESALAAELGGEVERQTDSLTLIRGYGAQLWLFVQALSQLKAVFRAGRVFSPIPASSFGTADYDTAHYISNALGLSTIAFETANRSRHTL